MKSPLAFALIAVVAGSLLVSAQAYDSRRMAGRATPDIEVVTTDGKAVTLDMSARDTVIYVIAPRTPACLDNLAFQGRSQKDAETFFKVELPGVTR